MFIQTLVKHKRLTDEETVFLVLAHQSGNREATTKLIGGFSPLIIALAKKYRTNGDIDDIVQDGVIGFIRALKTFNTVRGKYLWPYAKSWVRVYIQHGLIKSKHIVKPPFNKGYRQCELVARPSNSVYIDHTPTASGTNQPDKIINDAWARNSIDVGTYEATESQDLQDKVAKIIGRMELSKREQIIVNNRILSDDIMSLEQASVLGKTSRESMRKTEIKLNQRLSRIIKHALSDLVPA